MILHDEISVFQINMGTFDILIAAGDSHALLVEADYHLLKNTNDSILRLEHKKNIYTCIFLEDCIGKMFPLQEKIKVNETSVFFLVRNEQLEECALILERAFEMQTYSVHDFKLLPNPIGKPLRSLGIYAIRFDTDARFQYLVNFTVYNAAKKNGEIR